MDSKKFNRLISRIKSDPHGATELYNFYFPRIVAFITHKYRNFHLGEEVAQEFFTDLLSGKFSVDVEKPTAWIFRCCENLAKDYLKNDKKYGSKIIEQEAGDKDEPYERAVFGEYFDKLNVLDEETQDIIMLKIHYGYSFKEIAEQKSMNYNTVRQKFLRGRKKVQKIIKKM